MSSWYSLEMLMRDRQRELAAETDRARVAALVRAAGGRDRRSARPRIARLFAVHLPLIDVSLVIHVDVRHAGRASRPRRGGSCPA